MPELPEVETTLRGIGPYLEGRRVREVIVRRADLRWPIPDEISSQLAGQSLLGIQRRAKYLLLETRNGTAVLHLGMSGRLRLVEHDTLPGVHDHVDIVLDSGLALRFNDPRRFGCLLWQPLGETLTLLRALGPEPLSDAFNGDYLFVRSRGRNVAVKNFLMDQRVVVGVGNIYAAESLFRAGIRPQSAAGTLSRTRYEQLAMAVKVILEIAIEQGGTTLRDFLRPNGAPGYFAQELHVYGREGAPCLRCGRRLKHQRLGQRATVWCPHCQR